MKNALKLWITCLVALVIFCRGNAQNTVNNYKNMLAHLNKVKTLSDAKNSRIPGYLFNTLKDSIFPAWYGTTWDFNGTSNVPTEGEIACGYFVSTTLKHAGFQLNRYRLAQQAASVIVKAICGASAVKHFSSKLSIANYLKARKDGIFVVGLDYHVGFIVVENSIPYFVHADFFNGKVIREKIRSSRGFDATQAYVIGELTNNPRLLEKWMNNTIIY